MLEKDFYDKYHFKVLISRPQSVFTKAFVCVNKEHEAEVLASEYGKSMHFVENGRYGEQQADGALLYDMGDIIPLILNKSGKIFILTFLSHNLSIGTSMRTLPQKIKSWSCHMFVNISILGKR